MTLPQGVVDDLKAAVNASLLDSATIDRTSATLPVRVTATPRELPFEGMPHFVRMRVWNLMFQDGSNVKPGDRATIAGKGEYFINSTFNPATQSASALFDAIQTTDASGSLTIYTNKTVTFRHTTAPPGPNNPLTNIPVFLYEASRDLEVWPEAQGYKWAVTFDLSLGIDDASWEIVWTDVFNKTHTAVMTKPRQLMDLRAYGTSYFKED